MINTHSIQFRLILWYSCVIIGVLLAFGWYTYSRVEAQLYGNIEHTLSRRAQQIANNLLAHDAQPIAIAEQINNVYSPDANNRFIRILRADHSIFYLSGKPQDGDFDPAKIPLPKDSVASSRIVPTSGRDSMLIIMAPAEVNGSTYLIEMGAPTDEIEQALHGLLMALLYGLPVVILIVSTGGYVLVRRALQPVEHIRATAEKITFGNLSNRLPAVMTGDAIEHLSVTLNQMINRLENSYEQASRFSADASHELRTPLTIMRGELEAMAHQKDLPKHLQERLGSVLEETERLSHITESLFAISRLDAGEAMVEHRLCDLAALAQSTAEQMSLLAEEKQITLHINAPQLVAVIGDAARLKQVVVNLLDNAIKYTPDAGRVDLKVMVASSRKAVLEVSDNGSGIPADALPHVFTRFYRADKVRSRDMGGAGLGLSIVQSIVQAHGGTVEIFNNIQGITCRVELPLADHRREG